MYPRLACYKICCCVIAWSAHWEEVRLGLFLLCENRDGVPLGQGVFIAFMPGACIA